MLNADQYMERTPDLIARVRQMRETAEKEMNRFTRLADYDVRRVVGQKTPEVTEPVISQAAIEFPDDAVQHGDNDEPKP